MRIRLAVLTAALLAACAAKAFFTPGLTTGAGGGGCTSNVNFGQSCALGTLGALF